MSKIIEYEGVVAKLPHYRKNKRYVFKIFEDGHCMYAKYDDGQPKIGDCQLSDVFEDTKECTLQEFLEEHKKVRDYIKDMNMFFN